MSATDTARAAAELWPPFRGPSDLPAIERVPLSERGLPASTYDLVRRAAELWPTRRAVSVLPDGGRFTSPFVRTFAELADDVDRAAGALAAVGVRRGDAVSVISVNCAEMLPLLLAAEAVGIYAPINPGLNVEHATELVRMSGSQVIVAAGPELDPAVWANARAIAAETGARALLALRPTAPSGEPPALEPLAHRDGGRLPLRADGERRSFRGADRASGSARDRQLSTHRRHDGDPEAGGAHAH